jgi:peptide deformylase
MYNLCHTQIGPIPGSYAIHHSQIDDKHPLNFFVTADQEVVINPKIVRHTEVGINKVEGCVSHPYNPPIIVKRFNKIEVELSNLTPEGAIGPVYIKQLKGVDAQVYQHEINHGLAIYIYS